MRRFQPYSAVVSALRNSVFLDVVGPQGEEGVQRKAPYDPATRQSSKVEARSIYAKGFGEEEPSTQFDIETFFVPFGPTRSVRLRRSDQDRLFKGSVFVEFQDEETAQKFMDLEDKPKWKGEDLKYMTKAAYCDMKLKDIQDGKVEPKIQTQPYRGRGRGGNRGGDRGGRGRGDFKNRRGNKDGDRSGGRDREDRDPNDWKKRREDDRANGFKDDRRGGRGNRNGRGGRGGRDGRDNRNDRNRERDESGYDNPSFMVQWITNHDLVIKPTLRPRPKSSLKAMPRSRLSNNPLQIETSNPAMKTEHQQRHQHRRRLTSRLSNPLQMERSALVKRTGHQQKHQHQRRSTPSQKHHDTQLCFFTTRIRSLKTARMDALYGCINWRFMAWWVGSVISANLFGLHLFSSLFDLQEMHLLVCWENVFIYSGSCMKCLLLFGG